MQNQYQLIVFDWNGTLSTGMLDLDHPIVAGLYKGVHDMLDVLALEYHIAIATFASRSQLHKELEYHQIAQYIDAMSCGDDGPRKPEAAVLNNLMGEFNLAPQHTLMVGDSHFDIQCAHNAGTDCVVVTQAGELENPAGLTVTGEIAHIRDLPQWLQTHAGR